MSEKNIKNMRTSAVRCGQCAHLVKPVVNNHGFCERKGHAVAIIYDTMCSFYLHASRKAVEA